MPQHNSENLALLITKMNTEQFLVDINNDQSQAEFIASLEQDKYTSEQLIQLIDAVQNSKVKSLLIIHLLGQRDYLNFLKGESIIDRIEHASPHMPSRLNPWVHQLDSSTLNPTLIEKLEPEAAVSILFSLPQFHQLKRAQVNALLGKYPMPALIDYWVNHMSTMPNAHCIAAHLFKLADSHMEVALAKMDRIKKELLITQMIEHLELFNPIPKVLYTQDEQERLILAINLFNKGHKQMAYVTYIKQLFNRLSSNNLPFSLAATELALSLMDKPEFAELNHLLIPLNNGYIRIKAARGEIDLFYEQDKFTIHRAQKPVQLKSLAVSKTAPGLQVLSHPTATSSTSFLQNCPAEHRLITELRSRGKTVTSMDYFLMHTQRSPALLPRAIKDYLDFYNTKDNLDNPKTSIYHLTNLLNRAEIEHSTREAIFNAFLLYPDLCDEQVSYALFQFDAKKAIKHFGMQGPTAYQQVIQLCNGALCKLDAETEDELREIAIQAKHEAEFEIQLSQSGFFTQLFSRFIRCWTFGWTGFFSPNLPLYVAPIYSELPDVTNTNNVQNTKYNTPKTLGCLLNTLSNHSSVEELDDLVRAISLHTFSSLAKQEIDERMKLHQLFQELVKESTTNNELKIWLSQNCSSIDANRFRLLELFLRKEPITEFSSLLTEISESNTTFKAIYGEFSLTRPELNTNRVLAAQQPSLVNAATSIATTLASNWANTIGGFFTQFTQAPSVSTNTTPTLT